LHERSNSVRKIGQCSKSRHEDGRFLFVWSRDRASFYVRLTVFRIEDCSGAWHNRKTQPLAESISGRWPGSPGERRAAAGAYSYSVGPEGRVDYKADHVNQTRERHSLEHPNHGAAGRSERSDCAPHLARTRFQAPFVALVKRWLKRHPVPRALHSHQLLVAEYGRALLPRPDAEAVAPRVFVSLRNSWNQSESTSTTTTVSRSPSYGPPRRRTFSKRSSGHKLRSFDSSFCSTHIPVTPVIK